MEKIKRYLTNAHILVSYDSKRNFLLYVAMTLSALGAMLPQKDNEGKEREIYYISKTLIDYEIRYTPIEKLCFVNIFLIKKLRHYMLLNTNYVIAQDDSLRYLMSKLYLSVELQNGSCHFKNLIWCL